MTYKDINTLDDYLKHSDNFQEALDQLYQVYLGACEICKGDKDMELHSLKYLLTQVMACVGIDVDKVIFER